MIYLTLAKSLPKDALTPHHIPDLSHSSCMGKRLSGQGEAGGQSSHCGSYRLAMGKNSCQKGLLLLLGRCFCLPSLCFPLEHSSSSFQAISQHAH